MLSVVLIGALIFVLNVTVEYFVSVRWLQVPRQGLVLAGFVVANVASFAILVVAGFTILQM